MSAWVTGLLIAALGRADRLESMLPIGADVRGAVLCTSRWNDQTHPMLELTKDRGLAAVDLQIEKLFDPRGRVNVDVSMGNQLTLCYLTGRLLPE
jgi:hypothetical protein